jgi:hypothetical protein
MIAAWRRRTTRVTFAGESVTTLTLRGLVCMLTPVTGGDPRIDDAALLAGESDIAMGRGCAS